MVIVALDHVPHCFSREDGEAINRLILSGIERDGFATLSLAGVSDVPSTFVNVALVSLLNTYDFEWIKANVAVTHATRQATDMIRRCFANAQQSVAA